MEEKTWRKKYEVLVFDLDDTLLNTSLQCVEPATRRAFEIMIEAGLKATLEECEAERATALRYHTTQTLFAHIAQKFGSRMNVTLSTQDMAALGLKTYYQEPIPENLQIYPEVREVLSDLSARYMIFLVTMGRPEIQKQKVQKLKISHFFHSLFFVDTRDKFSKSKAFAAILQTIGLKPNLSLSVGNRLDLEIAQAKQLGMDTCFVVTDRHRSVPVTREEQPDYKIGRISEIIKVCQL